MGGIVVYLFGFMHAEKVTINYKEIVQNRLVFWYWKSHAGHRGTKDPK